MDPLIAANPVTRFVPYRAYPRLHPNAYVGPHVLVTGDVVVDRDTFIGPHAVIRGDFGTPVYIGPFTNLQDHTMIHAQPEIRVPAGPFRYAVHIDGEVSILHGAAVHGPTRVGRNTFIGQQACIFGAEIAPDCVISHNATVTGEVRIPSGRLVAPGQVVDTQAKADALPAVPGDLAALNRSVVEAYWELGRGYSSAAAPRHWLGLDGLHRPRGT